MAERPTAAQWAQLRASKPIASGALTTLQVTLEGRNTSLLVATDSASNLYLLIPVSAGPMNPPPPDLNGLKIRHHCLEAGEYLALIATPSHENVFNALCEEVIEAVTGQNREPWAAVGAIVRTWQSAWRPSRQEMDKTAQVGLFGELLVLQNLAIPCIGSSCIENWSGPDSERHDLTFNGLHIEIKSTRKSRHEHEISRLDQLRVPPGCRLLVISVLLEQSVGGEHSIATLIDSIVNLIRGDGAATDAFMTRLSRAGWSDEMRDSGELLRFHVRDASVYVVDDEFPRLPDDFLPPSGVVEVRYTVDLANLPTIGMEEAQAILRSHSDTTTA